MYCVYISIGSSEFFHHIESNSYYIYLDLPVWVPNGSVTGCQFTFFLGFNWNPLEGASIYDIHIIMFKSLSHPEEPHFGNARIDSHRGALNLLILHISGQISIIPKPELRGFWRESLY